jgi:SSS family solute:Na+ symporter
MEPGALVSTEYIMVAVFILGLVCWGYMKRHSVKTMDQSFLADRKVPGFIASLSTVATTLNVNDFVGLSGSVYAVGIIMAHMPLISGICLLFLSLMLVHKLRAMNVFTAGEWLGKRYRPGIGNAYSIVWSCIWMVFNLGLYNYGGALILHTLMGWNFYFSLVLLSVVGAFYTISGGFGVVVGTHILQVMLMFFPFLVIAPLAIFKAGGIANIVSSLPADQVNIWTPHTPFGPISLMFFGCVITTASFWSSEAQLLQRPLSSRSSEDASITYLGASFWFVILMPFLIIMPALASKVLFTDLDKPDLAAPMLIKTLLPHGLYGVAVVGLMSGFLSSAASQINSFCAMFTTDVYKKLIRPGKQESHYLLTSKIAGVIFAFCAVGTALLFYRAPSGMFIYAVGVLATIMPPFAAVIMLGAMWKKANSRGAAAGLIIGGSLAVTLFILANRTKLLLPIAEDTMFFRAALTYIVTLGTAWLFSLLLPAEAGEDQTAAATASVKITKRVWKLAFALFVAVTGMYVFLTFRF